MKNVSVWSRSRHTDKITIPTNFLAYFLFFPLKFGSGSAYWMRIRIQEGKWIRIHADSDPQPWDPQGSSIRIQFRFGSTIINNSAFISKLAVPEALSLSLLSSSSSWLEQLERPRFSARDLKKYFPSIQLRNWNTTPLGDYFIKRTSN